MSDQRIRQWDNQRLGWRRSVGFSGSEQGHEVGLRSGRRRLRLWEGRTTFSTKVGVPAHPTWRYTQPGDPIWAAIRNLGIAAQEGVLVLYPAVTAGAILISLASNVTL